MGFILGVVPARSGSKGVRNKNIRPVRGKPLMAHAIECGLRAAFVDRVIVSTDSEEFADIARSFGAEVPFLRPAELATDQAPMLPVLQHAVSEMEALHGERVECVVLLDPTAPLRETTDVERAVDRFRAGDCDAVISAHRAHRNPYFNMIMKSGRGDYVKLVCDSDTPVGRRQDAPEVFDLNTVVWVFSRRALMEEQQRIPGRSVMIEIPVERAIDIDTEEDLRLLELRMNLSDA